MKHWDIGRKPLILIESYLPYGTVAFVIVLLAFDTNLTEIPPAVFTTFPIITFATSFILVANSYEPRVALGQRGVGFQHFNLLINCKKFDFGLILISNWIDSPLYRKSKRNQTPLSINKKWNTQSIIYIYKTIDFSCKMSIVIINHKKKIYNTIIIEKLVKIITIERCVWWMIYHGKHRKQLSYRIIQQKSNMTAFLSNSNCCILCSIHLNAPFDDWLQWQVAPDCRCNKVVR